MQQRKIILFLLIFFIAGSAWLFHSSDKFLDPDAGKNWWALYFENPNDASLNFSIENHSEKTDFRWEVADEKNKLQEEDIKIEKGATTTIKVENNFNSKKIIIQVIAGDEKRELYKNF